MAGSVKICAVAGSILIEALQWPCSCSPRTVEQTVRASRPGLSTFTLDFAKDVVGGVSYGWAGSAQRIGWTLGCDVLVDVEEVAGIVGTLDLD